MTAQVDNLPGSLRWSIVRGDDVSLTLTFKTPAGAAINLSGRTYAATVINPATLATAATIAVSTASAAIGILTLSLTDTDTTALTSQSYLWKLVETNGTSTLTLLDGNFVVNSGGSAGTGAGTSAATVTIDTPTVTVTVTSGSSSCAVWRHDIFWTSLASANTNWSTQAQASSHPHAGYRLSTGAQNASVSYDTSLGAGTYTITIVTYKDIDRGIMTVTLGGVSAGTVDTYGGQAVLIDSTLAGIVIPNSGIQTLNITMASKNASSSSYVGVINAVHLTRTA